MTEINTIKIINAIGDGKTTAVEIAKQVIENLHEYDAVQPQVWISRFSDNEILSQAQKIDERLASGEKLPLVGVPFAVKDNIDVLGLETTAACPAYAYKPVKNATTVQNLLDAGALCIGKTNLDQFATGLVGVRSPHGAPACVFNREFVSGGSSSGSAVAVAAGLVAFSLGTDTAGSGRVPAAFNSLIGLKPTKGRFSTSGLVYACRTIDCISIFAHSLEEAEIIEPIMTSFDAADAYSRPTENVDVAFKKIGVARPDLLQWCGDEESPKLYAQALERLTKAGAELVEIDISPLSEAAALLYSGPWVAERTAAVEELLKTNPDALDDTVRAIAEKGFGVGAVETFKGIYRLAELARVAQNMWQDIDMLVLPTTPTIYKIAAVKADPIALNSNLGLYTNFVNLLDMAALAVPAGFRENNTGFGITFIGPAWSDRSLIAAGKKYLAAGDEFALPDFDL